MPFVENSRYVSVVILGKGSLGDVAICIQLLYCLPLSHGTYMQILPRLLSILFCRGGHNAQWTIAHLSIRVNVRGKAFAKKSMRAKAIITCITSSSSSSMNNGTTPFVEIHRVFSKLNGRHGLGENASYKRLWWKYVFSTSRHGQPPVPLFLRC